MSRPLHLTLFLTIFLLAAYFRFTGSNWDANQHLHPDERFLTQVAGALTWPTSLGQYLDPSLSPLNPHNRGFSFYVYGVYPVIIVKYFSQLLSLGDYHGFTLVGRNFSAFADMLTLLSVYLISWRLFRSRATSLFVLFAYAVSVLPIQLSHFFTVDPYATLFLTASFLFLTFLPSRPILASVFLGLSFGLAVSAKISSVIFFPIILSGFIYTFYRLKKFPVVFISLLIFIFVGYLSLRLAWPYLFSRPSLFSLSLNQKVLANWSDLGRYNRPDSFYPPSVLWTHITPFLFPLQNLLFWGLGLPQAIAALISLGFLILRYPRHPFVLLLLFWLVTLFVYQSLQYAQPMRYFYPIYPLLAITTGLLMSEVLPLFPHSRLALTFLLILFLVWPISFVQIYRSPHTRVQASAWIYSHLPPGSAISCEYWDDCLPLNLPNRLASNLYPTYQLPLYDPDTPQKWHQLTSVLSRLDYLILSSNRLYGSIASVPERYPTSSRFYTALFNGSLGFSPVAQFTSRPHLPLPGFSFCLTPSDTRYGYLARSLQTCPNSGLSFVDDYADETLTVYDHPKVIIFKKTTTPDYAAVLSLSSPPNP